jgi:hypothetical protein
VGAGALAVCARHTVAVLADIGAPASLERLWRELGPEHFFVSTVTETPDAPAMLRRALARLVSGSQNCPVPPPLELFFDAWVAATLGVRLPDGVSEASAFLLGMLRPELAKSGHASGPRTASDATISAALDAFLAGEPSSAVSAEQRPAVTAVLAALVYSTPALLEPLMPWLQSLAGSMPDWERAPDVTERLNAHDDVIGSLTREMVNRAYPGPLELLVEVERKRQSSKRFARGDYTRESGRVGLAEGRSGAR